ncbi:MAG: hypothetical protein QOI53_1712, partial [Verrucomicrobiota bacterium]|nr:hypothetical protein [Verrucomicrobiota bacterium]
MRLKIFDENHVPASVSEAAMRSG